MTVESCELSVATEDSTAVIFENKDAFTVVSEAETAASAALVEVIAALCAATAALVETSCASNAASLCLLLMTSLESSVARVLPSSDWKTILDKVPCS